MHFFSFTVGKMWKMDVGLLSFCIFDLLGLLQVVF